MVDNAMDSAKTIPLPTKDCFYLQRCLAKTENGNYTLKWGIFYTNKKVLCNEMAFRQGLAYLVCFLMDVLQEGFF